MSKQKKGQFTEIEIATEKERLLKRLKDDVNYIRISGTGKNPDTLEKKALAALVAEGAVRTEPSYAMGQIRTGTYYFLVSPQKNVSTEN